MVAKDICRVLQIKNYRDALRRIKKSEKKLYKFSTNGGIQNLSVLSKEGLTTLIISSRSPLVEDVAKALNIDANKCILLTKEQSTISIIARAFKHYKHEFQYQVGRYRLDIYFPDLNIAVECDEFDHRNYDKYLEIQRENYIKQQLGCKIIRFNPDSDEFNIGDVINEIMLNIQNTNKKVS